MYYIEITANSCICTTTMNGLGIDVLDATHTGSMQYPCNTELVGTANKVEVQVVPSGLDPATLDKIDVQGQVKRYPDEGFIGPEFGEVIASFSLDQTLALLRENPIVNIADLIPFSLSATFDSLDARSFADRLLTSLPIENPEILKEWAITFLSLLERRDIDSLFDLYEPKLRDYDLAYPLQKEPDNKVWFTRWLNDKIFPQHPVTKFRKDDLVCRKWCDGRVWEIGVKDGRPLWRTEGFEGKRTSVQIYVGFVEGTIKIIR